MNQNIAKQLMTEGATFVFLDVPKDTDFGIDMKSWTTGENFRGVKMIPPGIHYIFYSCTNTALGDMAPRMGFFYNFRQGEFVVRKWDIDQEVISKEIIPDREIQGLKQNITMLDNFLGPYPFDIYERWKKMTLHINMELIDRLTPLCGDIRSALELVNCTDKERHNKEIGEASTARSAVLRRSWLSAKQEERLEDDLLPHLKPKEGTELRFTSFPEKTYPDGATPAEITQHSLDLTYSLEQMIATYAQPMDAIGELQFAFICFLVGVSMDAFEHWKKLVILLCSCERAVKKYQNVYDAFISILEMEVMEIPEEFLADIVQNNNFVYVKLRQLFASVQASGAEGRLKMKVERFKHSLTNTYGWDFTHLESDDEDEQPVIVETY